VLENHTFVQGAIEPLKDALLDAKGTSNDASLDILEVLLAVASDLTFPHSGHSDKVLAKVDRLGAYMDGDVVNGKNVFRVMLPEVLRLALMASPGVKQGLDQAAGMLEVVLGGRGSAGSIGDRLEAAAAAFFKTHLYLSWFFSAPVSRVGRLLKLLGLQHVPLDFRQSLVKVDESSLGKVMRLGEEPTPQSVDSVMPRVFTGDAVRGQCVILLPSPQSHSADLFVSLPFLNGTHALLLVSCKATTSAPLPPGVRDAEVAKATAVVAALPKDARALYGDRIFLLFLEHPQASVPATTLTPHADVGFSEVHLDAGTTAELLGGAFLTPEQIQAAVGALKPKLKVGCTAQQRYRG